MNIIVDGFIYKQTEIELSYTKCQFIFINIFMLKLNVNQSCSLEGSEIYTPELDIPEPSLL